MFEFWQTESVNRLLVHICLHIWRTTQNRIMFAASRSITQFFLPKIFCFFFSSLFSPFCLSLFVHKFIHTRFILFVNLIPLCNFHVLFSVFYFCTTKILAAVWAGRSDSHCLLFIYSIYNSNPISYWQYVYYLFIVIKKLPRKPEDKNRNILSWATYSNHLFEIYCWMQ